MRFAAIVCFKRARRRVLWAFPGVLRGLYALGSAAPGKDKAPARIGHGIKKTGPRGAGCVLFCFVVLFFYFAQNVANAAINVV